MHGWGSDSSIWKPWEIYFKKKGWLWQNNDRGYGFNPAKEAKWIHKNNDNSHSRKVIICHSLGAHLINPTIFKEATDVILLSSFGRFIMEDRESRSVKVALQGMQKAFGSQSESKMLFNFLEKAFSPYKFNDYLCNNFHKGLSLTGSKKLKTDLDLLIKTKRLPNGLYRVSRLLTIFGGEDAILQRSSINSLINELNSYLHNKPTHWTSPNEGHFLLSPKLIKRVELWVELSK